MRRQNIVTVQNYKAVTGSLGQSEWTDPDGAPKIVQCNVYPLEADIIDLYGLQAFETRAVWCDSWPGDLHSEIVFEGAVWLQAAPPKTHNKSFNLLNVIVPIKRR